MREFWRHRNVFVTGATGLLGSWITHALSDREANVVALVRDNVPKSHLHTSQCIDRIVGVRGDLADRDILERTLGEYEIDTVFHAGAQTIVPIANRNPVSTFESNIRGTWNLLEAARRSSMVKRIITASSDKAYGEHQTLPYHEDLPLQGRYPYDVSKSCADLLAQSYFATYRLPVAVTRCGNFFGGGDLNFNRLIPGTIRSVLFDEPPVIRSNGNYVRDYLYIEDAVDAYLKLAEQLEEKNLFGQAFNFSIETQLPALDVVQKVIAAAGKNLKPVIEGTAENEIPHQFLSTKKAREMLGWEPAHSFDEGLEKTLAWYRNFFGIAA